MIDANTSVGAVTLKVADLAKMVAFYRDVIGLHVLRNSAERATLGTPMRPLIHLRHLPNGRTGQRHSGLFHVALRVSSRRALATWLRHYVNQGMPGWQGASDHLVSEALYLGDPENNGIEVYVDRPRSEWPYAASGRIELATLPLDLNILVREAEKADFVSIDPASVMGHVHLRVGNIATAQQFYVDLLGFDLMTQMQGSALFVAAGGYHHHLGLNVWQSRSGANNSAELYGLEQFEIVFNSAESRQQVIDRLIVNNHTLIKDGDVPAVYDPFQNRIALTIN